MRNPQAFQQIQSLQRNQGNPEEFLKQIISKHSPEQINNFRQYLSGFGFTDEQLNNYGIKTKQS